MKTVTLPEAAAVDQRVDLIGFCKELSEQIAVPANDALRAELATGTRVEGMYFDALRTEMSTETVEAEGFLKAWEKGTMTREQFVRSIKISTTEARGVLDEKTYKRLTTRHRPTPALRVTRKKGVTVEMGEALAALGRELAKKAAA